MPMKSKTTLTLTAGILEQLSYVRDCLVASARRRPKTANPDLLRAQVGLGTAIDELCRRYFRDMERSQRWKREQEEISAEEAIKADDELSLTEYKGPPRSFP